MDCREEITVRLTDLSSGPKVPLLFKHFCKGARDRNACWLYRNERIENDWIVAIEWSRVTNPDHMKVQRDWLVWALGDLGQVRCNLWKNDVSGE